MMQRLFDVLAVFFSPSYWLQNESLSKQWDRELTWLLDSGYRFDVIDGGYSARIGSYTVWIANHPYASFTMEHLRPRRRTIRRARRVLMEDRFPNYRIESARTVGAVQRLRS